jgi:hypothetical protein
MRDKFGVTMGRVRLDGIPTGAADWPSDLKNSGMLSVGSRSTAAGLSCSSIRRQVTLSRITPSTRSGWGESSGRVGVAKGSSIAAVLITSARATSGPDAARLADRLRPLTSSACRSTIRRTGKKGFSCSSGSTAAAVWSNEAKPDAIVTSGRDMRGCAYRQPLAADVGLCITSEGRFRASGRARTRGIH